MACKYNHRKAASKRRKIRKWTRKDMSKEEFVTKLKDEGFIAEVQGVLPTIYVDSMEKIPRIKNFAKKSGYIYSFSIKKAELNSQYQKAI